jgi:hypothetical protein
MKINTSNQPPLHVTFDYITLHDAMVQKVADFRPSDEMLQRLEIIQVPGDFKTDDGFGVHVATHENGIWYLGFLIEDEIVGYGFASILDEKSYGALREILIRCSTKGHVIEKSLPASEYRKRFSQINPSGGFFLFEQAMAVQQHPDKWDALATLALSMYWKLYQETVRSVI